MSATHLQINPAMSWVKSENYGSRGDLYRTRLESEQEYRRSVFANGFRTIVQVTANCQTNRRLPSESQSSSLVFKTTASLIKIRVNDCNIRERDNQRLAVGSGYEELISAHLNGEHELDLNRCEKTLNHARCRQAHHNIVRTKGKQKAYADEP